MCRTFTRSSNGTRGSTSSVSRSSTDWSAGTADRPEPFSRGVEEIVVERRRQIDHPFVRIVFANGAPSGIGHRGAERRVPKDAYRRVPETTPVAGLRRQAVLPVADHLFDAADPGGNDGDARGESLEDRAWKAFPRGGED